MFMGITIPLLFFETTNNYTHPPKTHTKRKTTLVDEKIVKEKYDKVIKRIAELKSIGKSKYNLALYKDLDIYKEVATELRKNKDLIYVIESFYEGPPMILKVCWRKENNQ